MRKTYFTDDIIEILNYDTPSIRTGELYYVKSVCNEPNPYKETPYFNLYTSHDVYSCPSYYQVRLFHRPFKNWCKLFFITIKKIVKTHFINDK